MTVISQPAPSGSYRIYQNRPVRGVALHHTADDMNGPLPTPSSSGSWHKLFAPNGDVIYAVPLEAAAFGILMTDFWRPSWVLGCPDGRVSDANYCTVQYEIQYAPQLNQIPTTAQIASVRDELAKDYARFGHVPIIGHGQVQSDKWRTEPTGFDYAAAGIGPLQPNIGRFFDPTEPPMNPADDATIKSWLESSGVGINPDTAIMKFVYDAFRQGPPPYGNWRGPARLDPTGQSGEYAHTRGDGSTEIRHRFSAGIVSFDPATGGLGWVEVVDHPDEIVNP